VERIPEFSRAEYEERWRRARDLMRAQGLDALLVTSEANYRYLSGHHSGFWLSKARPMMMLLPREAEPVLLLTTNQVPLAELTSPVPAIRAWDGFMAEGIPVLVEALRDLGLLRGRIGAELGFKQRLGMPVSELDRLRQLVPAAVFVDAADVLWRLRRVKSPAEVARLREAARITGDAYQAMFDTVRPGTTEREAHRTFLVELFRGGAERPGYIPITSGAGNYHRRTGGPTDRALEPGDLLWLDGGCSYEGYWADFSRMVAVGRATAEQAATYRAIREITHECLGEVRPGAPLAAIARRAEAAFERHGFPWGATARIGHGIGLDLTEPPSVRGDVEDPLEPGMVLTIEPTVVPAHGIYQLEEIYVVTPTGTELLTRPSPPELRVVP
jgi:Xaa-Pro aminopeptidase